MSDKRYQVFISSTFEDLRDERRAIQDTIIQMGDFPVQMESFPAADEGQFPFIKALIDQCDYYVLVVGGRYGTSSEDGLSYTHKEYRYAVEKGVPVLVIIHDDREQISVNKSEKSDDGRKKLDAFIKEVTGDRLRATWSNSDQLKLRVREALENAKATKPRVGWVRGDTVASFKTLEELNEVRRQNEKYRKEIGHFEIDMPLPELPKADAKIEIDFLPVLVVSGYGTPALMGGNGTVSTTWISAFPVFFSNLEWQSGDYNDEVYYRIDIDESLVSIGSALVQEVCDRDVSQAFKISKGTFERLSAYYIESGLMRAEGEETPFTDLARKFARRHRLTEPDYPHFVLSRGTTDAKPVENTDEIPF